MSTPKGPAPRSTSRSKRSTTNLANLRLAPLTPKFADDFADDGVAEGHADTFAKSAASHRSAPASPRALSRNSSRRYLGGLSRRGSLYENNRDGDDGNVYDGGGGGGIKLEMRMGGGRLEIASGQVPKAKSEAALGVPPYQQRLSGPGKRRFNAHHSPRSRASGSTTPRVKVEDDWLTRTGQAASSILAEQKGQSFIASRSSHTTLTALDTDEEDVEDERYEEMAAMSARTTRSGFADDELSPVSTRTSRWGSRYGSRKTSRRSSTVGFGGSRTPLASARTPASTAESRGSYFDHSALPVEADFLDDEDESGADDGLVSAARFSSLGGLVDRFIGIPLFNVDEGRETSTESEAEDGSEETEDEAEVRRVRGQEEKERLRAAQQRRFAKHGGDGGGGWQEDAMWLFGRAKEAWS